MMRIQKILSLLFVLTAVMVQAQEVKQWTLRECVEHALEHNISIKQSELNVVGSEINKSDAIGNFLPTVNGNASHSWSIGLNQNITTGLLENLTTQFTSARVSVGIDIFRGLQNVNQLRRANLNILANQYQLEDMRDD